MMVSASACFLFLFVYEYIVVVKKLSLRSLVSLYPYLILDTDIWYRKKKIEISQLTAEEKKNYRVVVNDLEAEVSKHNQYFKTLSFVLTEGRTFGILGHLNAGNVELCRKIGGLDKFVLGEIAINGYDLKTQRRKAQKNLSISIQTDPINLSMSAYEYLEVICYCRGVKANRIRNLILEISDMLFMKEIIFYPISTFDPNHIKLLSFAAALIGDIKVMIIDQPTSCLDPISKLAIWNVMTLARSLGKTIIFSTDALSEGEKMSDTMLFLVEGNIVGLSHPTEIRINACMGFYIEIRMAIEGKTPTEIEEKYDLLVPL